MNWFGWVAGVLTTLGLDLLWVGVVAQPFYRREVGHLMAERASFPPAFVFYALYGWGVWRFAAGPAAGLKEAALAGAGLGLVVYGTYDLTNMAILKAWPLKVTLVDVAWGVLLTACASAAAFSAARRFPG